MSDATKFETVAMIAAERDALAVSPTGGRKMTRDEFIADYCARSGVAWESLSEWRDAVPCACGEYGCEGWAMLPHSIINDPLARSLSTHIWPDSAAPTGEAK